MKKIIISSLLALGLVVNLGLSANASVLKINEPVKEVIVTKSVAPITLYSTTDEGGSGTSCSHSWVSVVRYRYIDGEIRLSPAYECEFCGELR